MFYIHDIAINMKSLLKMQHISDTNLIQIDYIFKLLVKSQVTASNIITISYASDPQVRETGVTVSSYKNT